MVLEQLNINIQMNEVGLLPHTTHKNQLKWIIDLNISAKTITLRRKYRHKSL